MKIMLIYMVMGVFLSSTTCEKSKSYSVSGKVTAAGSYCGGAAPSEAMLQQANATYPKSGFVIYFKKGTENRLSNPIIDSVSTDGNGLYSINLPSGTYVLLQKNQLNRDLFIQYKESTSSFQVNKEAMEKWWKKGLATISVEAKDIDSLNFHFQKRCFVPENMPFLGFMGPYPP